MSRDNYYIICAERKVGRQGVHASWHREAKSKDTENIHILQGNKRDQS